MRRLFLKLEKQMNIDSGYVGIVSNIGEVNQDVSIFEIAEFKKIQ